MTTVQQVLDRKGSEVWYISPDATVFDAITKMAEKDVGSLAVMDGDELVGVITERHYPRNVFLKGRASPRTLVRDVMEERVLIARPEQSVEQCMALMTDKRVRHLPVVDGKKLIGIISIGDLAAAYNIFNVQRHLTSAQSHRVLRAAAMTTWREAVEAA